MYRGIGPEKGTVVSDEESYMYALERCLNGTEDDKKEFREELVSWFYSGNWIHIKEEDDAEIL